MGSKELESKLCCVSQTQEAVHMCDDCSERQYGPCGWYKQRMEAGYLLLLGLLGRGSPEENHLAQLFKGDRISITGRKQGLIPGGHSKKGIYDLSSLIHKERKSEGVVEKRRCQMRCPMRPDGGIQNTGSRERLPENGEGEYCGQRHHINAHTFSC